MRTPKLSGGFRIFISADGSLVARKPGHLSAPRNDPHMVHRVGTRLFKSWRGGRGFDGGSREETDVFTEVPTLAIALMAREDATQGRHELVRRFAAEVLDIRHDGQWGTAVSDALLGDWVAPLCTGDSIPISALKTLRSRAWRNHADMQPIWHRRTGRSRVLLLDTPLGTNFTLYDLVAGSPSAADIEAGVEPDDARLTALLRALSKVERAVVLAWAYPGIATWSDAALLAGAAQPDVDGERVRRRVRYLVGEQRRRREESEGLWLPGERSRG
ncbi:hypothetical protein [Streptomyces clavifer]|uniref:hypothetical protein n=1 Tax=Streptomyces clavifer TaxID=68188 RepID=UPI0033EF38E7